MAKFEDHLMLLVGTSSSKGSSSEDRRALEQWSSLGISDSDDSVYNVPEDFDDEEPWQSVINMYSSPQNYHEDSGSVIDRLLSKPNTQVILPTIRSLLSSKISDDVISIELAELLGFEEIELVSEIISRRVETMNKLDDIIMEGRHIDLATTAKRNRFGKHQLNPKAIDLDPEAAQRRIEETLRVNAARPLFTGTAIPEAEAEALPHVYSSSSMFQNNMLSYTGKKYLLPQETKREAHEEYEEVIVPPARPVPPKISERLILVSELDDLCQTSFPGYQTLNRIQSIVYPTAYGTNENMLICAPTGAGKTDVAMLAILNAIHQFRNANIKGPIANQIQKDRFKIIYVAPMKALASEIVRKLGKRLAWLSILVRELTGDMQLTKAEIAETQIIVTTPEKWDVVTRKPTGEGELALKVKLLIIDEVHLLNDERGAVIETIVARTLRQVESTQSMIRIVGLSATLPNFVDVADFLRVSRYAGLFYFDSSFRPIPLEQHFLGIKGKTGSQQAKKNLDKVCYEKVAELVREGHQVMVFVHARKETVKTALALKDAAFTEGTIDDFLCEDHPKHQLFKRDVGESRNKEMKQLFDYGFGIHHAGMLRSDRNLMERLFDARAIKVLCCTATLAWGVNLPAHAVLIKGTQVYDSAQGKFVDLSVLDVLQIFGRAGRPGFETSGEGYICTPEDMLEHYLSAVTAQHPIESKFVEGMADSLNAEIALGTVTNVTEAVQWVGYTYLFVRMCKNPRFYGIDYDEILSDPQLGGKRRQFVESKAKQLASAHMIVFYSDTSTFSITDLGRIAAKFYIRTKTIEVFNEFFKPNMKEADLLGLLSKSTEFEQVQLRESEVPELKSLMDDEDIVPCQVKDGTNTSQGKVNILLQAHISRVVPEDFALVSDMSYVAQNAGRITRALLEISISRKWASVSAVLISLSKAIEQRIWPFAHPFVQFRNLIKPETFTNLTKYADEYAVAELAQLTAHELGELIHMNDTHGAALLRLAKEYPTLTVTHEVRPLTADLMRLRVHLNRSFTWGSKRKDHIEPFWVWVEDERSQDMLQFTQVIFRQTTDAVDVDFVLQMDDAKFQQGLTIRYVSDRWMGAEDEIHVPLHDVYRPRPSDTFTQLLSLPFLSLDAFANEALKTIFSTRAQTLNAIQSQSFWSLVNGPSNALISAPSGSGKTMLLQMTLVKTLLYGKKDSWALVLLPRRSLIHNFNSELRAFMKPLGISVEIVRDQRALSDNYKKTVRIITPAKLISLSASQSWMTSLQNLALTVCDNLELLDAYYELALTILLHATSRLPVRFAGASSSLVDATDLSEWLQVPSSCLNCFSPSDRDQDLKTIVQPFTIPHSAALFKAMAKPVHMAISSTSGESALVFVPSRAQCRQVSNDLITQCAIDLKMQGYLPPHLSADALEPYLSRLRDRSLEDVITHGIGIFHDEISKEDRALILELFVEDIIRVIVLPRDCCWSFPLRTGVVVVMGTQYVRLEGEKRDRQIKDYSIADIAHMQGLAVRQGYSGRFHLLCQAEAKETLTRFLNEGLPLESMLHESPLLKNWLQERWKGGVISDKQTTMDILSWSYLARRMTSNPIYYDAHPGALEENLSKLVDLLHAPSTISN